MKATIAAVLASMLALAFPSFSQDKADPSVSDLIGRGKSHVQMHIKDMHTAEFQEVWPYRTNEGRRAVCGKVTSKRLEPNGPRRFAVAGTTVLIEGEPQFDEQYAAWCFSPIADDGSLPVAPERSNKYSTDLELKGQRIGDHKSQLSAVGWNCGLGKKGGSEEICVSNPGTLGGVPCTFLSVTYYDSVLHSIVAFIEHKDFNQLKVAMIAKFGKPKVTVSEYQNAMGSKFSGATLEWIRDGGNVALIERASKLTQSAAIVQSHDYNALSRGNQVRQGIQGVPDL